MNAKELNNLKFENMYEWIAAYRDAGKSVPILSEDELVELEERNLIGHAIYEEEVLGLKGDWEVINEGADALSFLEVVNG